MCTVTYIPCRDSIYLTSNRDEKKWRTAALTPAIYAFSSGKILFPKDGDAGGTWIAGHENGNAVVFLNGAFQTHIPAPSYRKSRGLILLDLLDHSTPYNCFLAVKLNNIEPFTAIVRDNKYLFECRWDGLQKHFIEMDPDQPHIWSSATLYDEPAATKRKKWFEEWISNNKEPDQSDIFNFHQFTGEGDIQNDLMMNRDGKVFTVSITSIDISVRSLRMDYLDLKDNKRSSEQLLFETLTAGR